MSGDQAFRWTEEGGFQQFEHNLQYFLADNASAASYDGSVITGQGRSLRGHEAWIWDEQHGVRLLTDLVTEMGIDLQGQHLESATSISADGTVIAGRTWGPLGGIGYVMVVPEPTGLSAAAVVAVTAFCRRRRRG